MAHENDADAFGPNGEVINIALQKIQDSINKVGLNTLAGQHGKQQKQHLQVHWYNTDTFITKVFHKKHKKRLSIYQQGMCSNNHSYIMLLI